VTQLELPLEVTEHGLRLAHAAGVPTILNAAPALELPRHLYGFCDYVTPNESEPGRPERPRKLPARRPRKNPVRDHYPIPRRQRVVTRLPRHARRPHINPEYRCAL
jgi:sugar/nucleoside kinase (ribokinase family)